MPEENRDNLRGGKLCRGRASGHYFRTVSEKLGDRSRNRLNQGCLIGCSEPHSARFSTWFILLKPFVHDASYQRRIYV